MVVPRPVVVIVGVLLAAFFVLFALILVHAWNDYQNSMLIEFRNATDERLCHVFGQECNVIKPNATSYGDFGSCPTVVVITRLDGTEIYSRQIDCDGEIGLSDLFVLINKRGGEFVVLDNVAPD